MHTIFSETDVSEDKYVSISGEEEKTYSQRERERIQC